MVLGERQDPDCLAEILDGALVVWWLLKMTPPFLRKTRTTLEMLEKLKAWKTEGTLPEVQIATLVQSTSFRTSEGVMIQRLRTCICRYNLPSSPNTLRDSDSMEQDTRLTEPANDHPSVVRTKNEDLPYLFSGAGTCTP
jgi:hypothetical protein